MDFPNEPRSIYDAARTCSRLFEKMAKSARATYPPVEPTPTDGKLFSITSSAEKELSVIEDLKGQFNLWIDYTGALSHPRSCLDARLHTHQDIKKMILEMLEMVHRNLQYEAFGLEHNLGPDQNLPKLEKHQEILPGLNAVRTAIARLLDLAVAIRHSARHVPKQSLLSNDPEREQFCYTIVKRRFPHAQPSLCNQLAASIHARGTTLQYLQLHNRKLARQRSKHEREGGQEQAPQDSSVRNKPADRPDMDFERQKPESSATTAPSRVSIAPFKRLSMPKIKPSGSISSIGSSVRESPGEEFSYPIKPSPNANKTYESCALCADPLEMRTLTDKEWKRHVHKDLEPYVCLAEDCRDPLRYFVHELKWMDHMQIRHTMTWAQKVHTERWYCDIDHDDIIEYEERSLLVNHLQTDHREQFTELKLQRRAARNRRIATRDEFVCPLCCIVPENIEPHIKTKPYKLLSEHIAHHLLSLAFLSISYVGIDMGETQGAAGSVSTSSANMEPDNKDSEWLKQRDSESFDDIPETEILPGGVRVIGGTEGQTFDEPVPWEDSGDWSFWTDWSLSTPTLQEQLGELQHGPWEDNRYFNANNDLRRLITPESIFRQMRTEKSFDCMQIQQDTTVIISEHAHKLFATLVFAGLGHRILELLGEGIDDTDLPFIWPKSARERRKYLLCSQKKQDKPIECTVTWDRRDIIDILKTQWCMLAPVIEFTDNVEHYEFEHNRVLPWMEDHEFSKPGRTEKAIVGAFSSVWKIKIHPAHQRVVPQASLGDRRVANVSSLLTDELECSYPYTALKRLHRTDEQSFSSQVATLKKFRKYPHASLAKLLATFRWKDKYYLIFPFPESNLREFWRATPLLAYSYDNVFWVLKQCRAITSGLHVIHTHRRYKHAPAGDRNHDEQSRFGPHGDLKAENILWFPEQGMEYGNLVIADSGLTDFHQCATRSDVPAGHVIGSPSYEPPELMLHSIISRAWDIWTLGCLFLELVTWLVCGSDVLEGFPVARREEDPLEPNLTDDTFFTIIGEGSSGASTKHAILRSAVSTWIKDLHKMPRCSAFVHDFLDLIANEMLLVDPKARIKIGDLNQEFLTMIERAKDPSYLTKGVPKTPRDQHDPNPSSLAALRLSGHIFPGTSDGTPLPRKASSD